MGLGGNCSSTDSQGHVTWFICSSQQCCDINSQTCTVSACAHTTQSSSDSDESINNYLFWVILAGCTIFTLLVLLVSYAICRYRTPGCADAGEARDRFILENILDGNLSQLKDLHSPSSYSITSNASTTTSTLAGTTATTTTTTTTTTTAATTTTTSTTTSNMSLISNTTVCSETFLAAAAAAATTTATTKTASTPVKTAAATESTSASTVVTSRSSTSSESLHLWTQRLLHQKVQLKHFKSLIPVRKPATTSSVFERRSFSQAADEAAKTARSECNALQTSLVKGQGSQDDSLARVESVVAKTLPPSSIARLGRGTAKTLPRNSMARLGLSVGKVLPSSSVQPASEATDPAGKKKEESVGRGKGTVPTPRTSGSDGVVFNTTTTTTSRRGVSVKESGGAGRGGRKVEGRRSLSTLTPLSPRGESDTSYMTVVGT